MSLALRSCVAFSLGACAATAALAGVVVTGSVAGDVAAGWQAFPGALNNYADAERAYWDQASKDGGNRNIGNYLSGTYTLPLPPGAVTPPGITPSWWGFNSRVSPVGSGLSNLDPSIRFNTTGTGTTVTTTLRLEVAGFHNFNEIGWYDTSDAVGAEALHVILRGSDAAPTVVEFTPGASWGLYLRTHKGFSVESGNGDFFFFESNRNRAVGKAAMAAADLEVQHFALFAGDLTSGREVYHVGVEDLRLSATGIEQFGDYNDVVFTLSSIPTPGSLALAGLGTLVSIRRRRR